jgi:type IV pilus assembly protein PilO
MAEKKDIKKPESPIRQKTAAFFDRVGKMSRRRRLLICLCTLVLISGAYYYFFFMPKQARWDEVSLSLETRTVTLNVFKQKARALKEWQEKMARAEEAFYIATRALPDKKEIPSLLKSVSRAGSSAGLNFVLFQPDPEVNRDFYREIPLSMKVEGTYHQIADFFFQVSQLNRIVNIRNIFLKRNKSASGVIDMTCNAVTYMFVETEQQARQNKNKKKG